ncbi:MAG: hypothetical protein IJ515_04980 [Clostridia bacterium]|nr:hypothetical protein [Clostridia bacterium]
MKQPIPITVADELRFSTAKNTVLSEQTLDAGIGTLSEKTLHKILKLYIEPDSSKHEIKHLGSIADVKNEDGIFEIQTRNYDKLFPKLKKFLPDTHVTVICPLASEKYVRWINKETGEIGEKRKSPKRESIYDAFKLLFGIRGILPNENLTVRVMYLKVDDFRYLNGWDKSRKRGSSRMERIPNAILGEQVLRTAEDYADFIPSTLGNEFTAPELAREIKRTSRFTFYVLKLLVAVGALSEAGKRGRVTLYKRNFPI